MIEAILFDVGGVYLKGSVSNFVHQARQVLGIDNAVKANESAFHPGLNKGTIDHDTAFREFFGVPINEDQMRRIKELWTSNWKPDPEMSSLVNRLKKRYVLAVLSNSEKLNSDNFQKKGLYDPFRHLILSHELGVIKPEPYIYRIALQRVGIPAHQCLFLDDQEDCAQGARDMGMWAEVVRSYKQAVDALASHNVRVNQ
jgi:HAD superfamily hydrolase (TIGR01509 family)